MTHTADFNFVRVAHGLDVKPLLKLLDNKPELWTEITARQSTTNSPHKDTECIYVRGPLKMSLYYVMHDLGSYDYPCMKYLQTALVPLMRPVLESKDQIKKRLQGAGSPDLADALALTFALPVAKKVPEDIYIKRRKEATGKTEYDPHTRL